MNPTKLFALGEREKYMMNQRFIKTLRHSIKMPITTTKLSMNCAVLCAKSLQKADETH